MAKSDIQTNNEKTIAVFLTKLQAQNGRAYEVPVDKMAVEWAVAFALVDSEVLKAKLKFLLSKSYTTLPTLAEVKMELGTLANFTQHKVMTPQEFQQVNAS